MRDVLRRTLVEEAALLAGTARTAWRHWPVLLAIAFTGIGLHQLVITAATWVGDTDPVLGYVVVVGAPLAMLSALILMLRVVSGPPRAGTIGHVGGLLVPFLAAYETQGDFRDDMYHYAYRSWLHGTGDTTIQEVTVSLVVVMVLAVVARHLLVRAESRFGSRWSWLGYPAAYLELLWLTVVVMGVATVTDQGWDWFGQRRLSAVTQDGWDQLLGLLGPVRAVADTVQGWIGVFLRSVTTSIIRPLAWLAVAAILLGELRGAGSEPAGAGPDDAPAGPDGDAQGGRDGDAQGRDGQARGAAQDGAPRRLLRVAADRGEAFLRTSVGDRFGPLLRTVQQVRRTGVVLAMTFCLTFLAARAVHRGLWELQRLVVGPQELFHGGWFQLSAVLSDVNQAITLVVTTCVLAVAAPMLLHRPQRSPRRARTGPAGRSAGRPAGQELPEGTVSAT